MLAVGFAGGGLTLKETLQGQLKAGSPERGSRSSLSMVAYVVGWSLVRVYHTCGGVDKRGGG